MWTATLQTLSQEARPRLMRVTLCAAITAWTSLGRPMETRAGTTLIASTGAEATTATRATPPVAPARPKRHPQMWKRTRLVARALQTMTAAMHARKAMTVAMWERAQSLRSSHGSLNRRRAGMHGLLSAKRDGNSRRPSRPPPGLVGKGLATVSIQGTCARCAVRPSLRELPSSGISARAATRRCGVCDGRLPLYHVNKSGKKNVTLSLGTGVLTGRRTRDSSSCARAFLTHRCRASCARAWAWAARVARRCAFRCTRRSVAPCCPRRATWRPLTLPP
mmetsp:Transcript_8591/g.35019  ORF Transcript_8591/g.35019 Transcript_8591/m.35019 type:complete len:278 (+) Transcript_8591:80-913(+)